AALLREAFETAQWSGRNEAGEAIGQLGTRLAAGGGERGAAIREHQNVRESWQERERTLLQLAATGGGAARLAAARRQMGELEHRLAALETDMRSKYPQYEALAGFEALALNDVQSLLAAGEAIVVMATAEDETFIFAATRNDVRWRRADLSEKKLAELI